MDNNAVSKLWFCIAICFIMVGIAGKNTVFIILGCAYICIGLSMEKKAIDKDEEEK